MQIYVKGDGEKSFTPNQIEVNFEFKIKEKEYSKVLALGVENVKEYLELLQRLGFDKTQIKTKNLRVSEDNKYDEKTRKYILQGYMFSQTAILTFDYDFEKLSMIMDETSKFKNPPTYRFMFTLKDETVAKDELLQLAYENAKSQAEAIAKAAGLKIKCCEKVSFEPLEDKFSSAPSYDTYSRAKCCSEQSVRENIQAILIPEDITASCEVYCMFVAE